jgi:NAD(P)-dependent dehydrogenase (short-subunit alcohol dehydrogenase family)
LIGRRALVTGAAGGIGRGIVDALTRAGATVATTDLAATAPPALASLVSTERYFSVDLADPAASESLVGQAAAALGGPIDLLVNNAAVITNRLLADVTAETMESVFAINFRAPILLSKSFAAQPDRPASSAIVNITSVGGLRAVRVGGLEYGSLKAALVHATAYLARELGPEGVRVNSVAPGSTASGHSAGRSAKAEAASQAMRERVRTETPLGRLGAAGDVADVVVFFASPASRHMTGQTVVVDGGWLLS